MGPVRSRRDFTAQILLFYASQLKKLILNKCQLDDNTSLNLGTYKLHFAELLSFDTGVDVALDNIMYIANSAPQLKELSCHISMDDFDSNTLHELMRHTVSKRFRISIDLDEFEELCTSVSAIFAMYNDV